MAYSNYYTGLTLCENCGLVFLDLDSDAYKLYHEIINNNGLLNISEINEFREETFLSTEYSDHSSKMAKSKRKVLEKAEKSEPRKNIFSKKSDSIYSGISDSNFKYVFNCEYKRGNISFVGYIRGREEYEGYAVAKVVFDEKYTINNSYKNLIAVKQENHSKASKCPCCGSENTWFWRPIIDGNASHYGCELLHNLFGYDIHITYDEDNCEVVTNIGRVIKDANENPVENISIIDLDYNSLDADQSKAQRKVKSFVNKMSKLPTLPVLLVENTDEKDCVLALLNTEKNIEILTKRLQDLYYSEILFSNIISRAEIRINSQKEIQICDIRNSINQLSKTPEQNDVERYFGLIAPKKPQKFDKAKPAEPLYSKPNIFNKKRVAIENEQKKSNYEKQLALFEEELQQYNEERKKREDELKEYTNVLNKKTVELSEIRKKQIVQLEKKIDEIKSSTVDNNLETIKYVNQLNLCCEDISECEKLLKKFYQAKKQLLSLNVVFPKYANIVALSVIYEYLLVGRCTSLAGADGAYNLYESELRQNIIISKLDKIIDELEQIKENQFTTYQILSEINDGVTGLNDKFGDVITSLNKIEANTQDIKELSEYVAYNTAKTAYYSKANAELANALGYMIALK